MIWDIFLPGPAPSVYFIVPASHLTENQVEGFFCPFLAHRLAFGKETLL